MKFLALLLLVGCLDTGDDDDLVDTTVDEVAAGVPGVNSDFCLASPYNCRFREGGSRVQNAAGDITWAIMPGASVREIWSPSQRLVAPIATANTNQSVKEVSSGRSPFIVSIKPSIALLLR